MQSIYTLKHFEIQRALRECSWIVGIILRSLGINNQATIQEKYRCILNDIKKMNFKIKYDRVLCNAHGNQSVPAFTIYLTSNRTDGGIILLNQDCSVKEQFECIIHEYIHIKDYSLPLSTTNIGFFKDKTIFYKFFTDFDKAVEKYQDVYKTILDDLKKMDFKIIVMDDPDLKLPVFTKFNSPIKTDGGTITLNSRLTTNEKLEALYHAYVGIIDYSLPIYETNEFSPGYKVLVDNSYQKLVEFHADVRTYTILMPQEKLRKNLFENAYNIDAILKQYNYYMETDVVLQWITINTSIPCHFAWVIYQKDNNNNIVRGLIHDNCYYDPPNNPQLFGIETVLNNADSAATRTLKSGIPVNQYSTIDNKEYYCYAYYEANHSKEVRNDDVPGSVTIHYDRLLVIGWEKAVYDTMQYFTGMFKEIQRK